MTGTLLFLHLLWCKIYLILSRDKFWSQCQRFYIGPSNHKEYVTVYRLDRPQTQMCYTLSSLLIPPFTVLIPFGTYDSVNLRYTHALPILHLKNRQGFKYPSQLLLVYNLNLLVLLRDTIFVTLFLEVLVFL